MITLKNIEKTYTLQSESIEVLKNISLELKPGELTYLLGESGCGKSTLLHIIGGIDQANSGKYYFQQQNLLEMSDVEWASFRRERIGFVFQNFHLISHLTALENIEMSMVLDGQPKQERRKRALELLEMVDLKNRANHFPNQLSGGQKQRVAIARALANNPDIILADEPTGALDSKNSKQIMDILKKIACSGKTVLVITHSLEYNDLADRIIKMKDGTIISDVHLTEQKDIQLIKNEKKKTNPHLDFFTSFKLSMRNIRNKKWRNFLTAFGSSIGIFGILIILALSNGVQDRISSTVDIEKDAYSIFVTKEDKSLIEDSIQSKLAAIDGVEEVINYTPFQISLQTEDGNQTTMSAKTLASEKLKDKNGKDYIVHGQYPKDDTAQIIIPERIAEELFKESKLAVGKKVNMTAQLMSLEQVFKTVETEAIISGIIQNESFALLDSIGITEYLSTIIMNTHDETANRAYSFKVFMKYSDLEKVQSAIHDEGFVTQVSGESAEEINQYVDMAALALGLLAAISLIVSSIMIGIVLYVSVIERTKEIGILKAIGATNVDIRRIFVTEGFCIALIGGIFGTVLALGVGQLLNLIIKNAMDVTFTLFQFNLIDILLMLMVSAIIGVLSSFIPSFKAARQNPLEALRYE